MDIANTPSGSYILFGEDLIHGGAPNTSDECRISLKFHLVPEIIKQTHIRDIEVIFKNFAI